MAKELDALNEVYTEILGEGQALEEENASEASRNVSDGAYKDEDYSDDAEDGIDPREDVSDEADDDDDFLGTGSEEDDEEEYAEEDDGDTDDYEEIPERLVRAGRIANLSDDAIQDMSETHPEALEALARAQDVVMNNQSGGPHLSKTAGTEDGSLGDEDSVFKPIEVDLTEDDEDEMGTKAVKLIRSLTETVNKLGGEVSAQKSSFVNIQQQTENERIRQIDSYFDKLSDEIPSLGKIGSLTEKQKQNRIFAYNSAREAQRIYGLQGSEEALAVGANALRGQQTKAQVKGQIVQELDSNKKRFTSRARSRKRPEARKSTRERAMDSINKILDSKDY